MQHWEHLRVLHVLVEHPNKPIPARPIVLESSSEPNQNRSTRFEMVHAGKSCGSPPAMSVDATLRAAALALPPIAPGCKLSCYVWGVCHNTGRLVYWRRILRLTAIVALGTRGLSDSRHLHEVLDDVGLSWARNDWVFVD